MRKYLLALAGVIALVSPARAADTTVNAMTAAGAIGGTELLYCVQGGVDRKCTPAQLNTYVQSLWGTGVATFLGTPSSANLRAAVTDETGTGLLYFQGGALGTPSSGTLTNATGLPLSTGISGFGAGVATAAGNALSAAGGLTTTIASGTAALATGAISSGTCAAAVTAVATGTATTDVVLASFNGDPTAVTGYIPSTSGMLTIITYPTVNTFNAKVCNNTAGSITPGAITLNWRVLR